MSEEHVVQFDVTEAYNQEIRPLIEKLTAACQALGVQYEMIFCYSHTHDAENNCLGYGNEVFVDAEGEKIPVQMALACKVSEMDDDEAVMTAMIMEGASQVIDKIDQQRNARFN